MNPLKVFPVLALGAFSLFGQASTTDLAKLKIRALSGDTGAQLRLGYHFSKLGSFKNPKESFYWFEMAAKTGEPTACHYLGKAYASGEGVVLNSKLSQDWYRRAAISGDAVAMAKLGEALSGEASLEATWPEAHAWLSLAVENGEATWVLNRDKLAKQLTMELQKEASSKLEDLRKEIQAKGESPTLSRVFPKAFGKYEYENGQKYLGGLRKDIPHGYGRLRTKDGESYYGEFDEGAPSGYGTLFSRDGLILFTGLWKGDKAVAGESPQARLRARLNLP